jgi:signal transduction histidine kinase
MKPPRRNRMRKVLVVDPSFPERTSIWQILKDDYVVLTSGDLKSASKLAEQEKVEIAVIGTDLPVASNVIFLRALQSIRPPLLLLLLLDEKSWGEKIHFLSTDWLLKPVHARPLREKLKALLLEQDWYENRMNSFPPPNSSLQTWEREIFLEAAIPILAHEIKNPLVTINTFTSLLPEKFDDSEFRNDFARLAYAEVSRINTLLDRLFEYADLCYPKPSPIQLNSALVEFLEKEKIKLSGRGISVTTHFERDLPVVNFDGEHLMFILRRLLEHLLLVIGNGKSIRFSSSCIESGTGEDRKRFAEVKIKFDPLGDQPRETPKGINYVPRTGFEKWSLSLLLAWRVMGRNHSVLRVTWPGEEMKIGLLFSVAE